MKIKTRFLDHLKIQADFDDYSIIADQPIRYNGNGTAPGPFDYFLASSAMCAAYFVKVYCLARKIPTDEITLVQNNIVDPENRYQQIFKIEVDLPESISEHDREGILKSIDRCTVKKVIQQGPEFQIEINHHQASDSDLFFSELNLNEQKTMIPGKDASLEETIAKMTAVIKALDIKLEIASWRNPVPHVWSVHLRDADSPMCFTNGKGATKNAALCSALGEYLERLSNNYFYNDYFLGKEQADASFVHYPHEKWFQPGPKNSIPKDLMDEKLHALYNPDGELKADHLIDTNSGNLKRGICALPYIRQSDQQTVYIPVNLIGNLFVSNGMSAGNTQFEARVQCLSEIFERAIKNKIILEEITLPDVPADFLSQFPKIVEGILKLESEGYPILVKDASLGGQFPVMCVTLMNPKNGGVFVSFGAHPTLEIALERALTELLQGRSFEGLNVLTPPTFNREAVTEHNNIIDHFIDSTGVVSWKFFSQKANYPFTPWNFTGSTDKEYQYLMNLLKKLNKEVYICEFEHLGVPACRILVPDFSEIYLTDDLIWDNHNKAINFREDILNLHLLKPKSLEQLFKKLDQSEIDDYTRISELIGIAFDENSVWGQLNIGELKCLILLALKRFHDAKQFVEMFLTFNDNSPARKRFYQILNILLEIELDRSLKLSDYLPNLEKMYGAQNLKPALDTISGEVTFFGLTPTDLNLKDQEKHLKLLQSYQKIQAAKARFYTSPTPK